MTVETSRRGFIAGLAALIVAPAIVQASNLMPVKPMLEVSHNGSLWLVQWGERTIEGMFDKGKIVWDSRQDLAPGIECADLPVIGQMQHALLRQPVIRGRKFKFVGERDVVQRWDQELRELSPWAADG